MKDAGWALLVFAEVVEIAGAVEQHACGGKRKLLRGCEIKVQNSWQCLAKSLHNPQLSLQRAVAIVSSRIP